ncbi:MAG: tRNA glutamyl-Q(34) synthetase GluQRS [Acidobacteria bacterium]|nr:tRNA glutamyl-Q(34) synthetase GluQRS [Acidobacteriota bacterium]
MTERYIGRLAPSPTGLLHLGHAATFWAAYQRAKEHNGTLLLRNEDLDPQRSKQHYVEAMLEDLAWLGIAWTPPIITQSQRIALYREAFVRLLASGHVYACTCSRKELAEMVAAPHEDTDDEPVYTGKCRPTRCSPAQSLQPNTNYRFRVPDGEVITFHDANLGPQNFIAGKDFGDFLIWRKDDLPSYQLACIVDDADSQIAEVVRGADLLKSTARQILLQRALSLPPVDYFHTRLLRDEHGMRLAKRHDALALRTLREQGKTPADVIQMFSA